MKRVVEAIQLQLLALVEREWLSLSEAYRPFGVWTRQYAPLPKEADQVDPASLSKSVWFLDEKGLRVENVWKWLSFLTMQDFVGSRHTGDRTFAIGLAAFALYENQRHCCSEMQWGPRWGQG